MSEAIHLNLDNAWPASELPVETVDATAWGPRLRFSAPAALVEEFYRLHEAKIAPFVVYGSGDFHHLSALWARRVSQPFVLVSFDNHPDWDVRPPRWVCGGWINRALELPLVQKVSVWGCGNFECWWPRQLFGNRRAEREGRLDVHPWADDRSAASQNRRGAVLASNWREHFARFAGQLAEVNVYVTIDLDCLRAEDAITNWENGRFGGADVAWALSKLREARARIVAGDICGAFSPPQYARAKQRLAASLDHPKLPPMDLGGAQRVNLRTFQTLWPLLAGSSAPSVGGSSAPSVGGSSAPSLDGS